MYALRAIYQRLDGFKMWFWKSSKSKVMHMESPPPYCDSGSSKQIPDGKNRSRWTELLKINQDNEEKSLTISIDETIRLINESVTEYLQTSKASKLPDVMICSTNSLEERYQIGNSLILFKENIEKIGCSNDFRKRLIEVTEYNLYLQVIEGGVFISFTSPVN